MKNKLFKTLLASFILISTFVLPVQAQGGKSVNESITKLEFQSQNLTVGEYSSLLLEFDADATGTVIEPGDTIDLDFSKQMEGPYKYGLDAVGSSMNLHHPETGILLARASITKDHVRLTFTDNVQGLEGVRGNLKITTMAVHEGEAGTRLNFSSNLGVSQIVAKNIAIYKHGNGGQPGKASTIQKLGSPRPAQTPEEQDRLHWVLYVNADREYVYDTVYLEDIMSPGQTIDEDSIYIRYVDTANQQRSVSFEEFKNSYGSYEETEAGFRLTLGVSTIQNSSFEFMYDTIVTDHSYDTYSNTLNGNYRLGSGHYTQESSSRSIDNIFASASITGQKPEPGYLRITKVVENTEEGVEGVVFDIYQGDTLIDSVVTTSKGSVDIALKDGSYRVQERETLEWLELDTTPQNVVIDHNQDKGSLLVFENKIRQEDVIVEKEWVGGPSLRPSVNFQLIEKVKGEEHFVGTEKTLEPGETKVVFENLPVADAKGNPITYSVKESGEALKDYESKITRDSNGVFKVTNTFIKNEETIDITVDKTWIGGPENRPNIDVELLANGNAVATQTLPSGSTSLTFKDMPAYDETGRVIDYSAKEVTVPNGYAEVVIDKTHIVNQYMYKDVEVGKQWVGGPNPKPNVTLQLLADGEETDYEITLQEGKHTFKDLPIYAEQGHEIVYTVVEKDVPENYSAHVSEDGLTVVNTFQSPTTDVTARKIWDNGGQIVDSHPFVTFKLFERVGGVEKAVPGQVKQVQEGEVVFEAVPIFNQDGEEIEYFVKEFDIPENYKQTTHEDGLTITNTFTPQLTSVQVEKEWLGGPNPKPSVQFQLYANDEKVSGSEGLKTLTPQSSRLVFANLPQADVNGPITYRVEELPVEGYVTHKEQVSVNHYRFTNTFTIEEKEIIGRKVWVGGPSPKPDINLQLMMRSSAFPEGTAANAPIVTLKDGETEANFGFQPTSLEDGSPIEYYILENNPPQNYLLVSNPENELEVINVYDRGIRNVVGTKEWRGGPDIKPEIQLKLMYRDPVTQEIIEEPSVLPISLKSGETSVIFKNLPVRHDDGTTIEYFVYEVETPDNYVMDQLSNTKIVNTYQVPTQQKTYQKVWIGDAAEHDIKVKLYAKNETGLTPIPNTERILSKGNYEISYDIPVTDIYGNPIDVVIRETEIPQNYAVSYDDEHGIITNTYDPEMRSIRVDKIWDGGPGPKGDLTITLYQNDTIYQTQTLEPGITHTTFENLPVHDKQHNPYIYKVEESIGENEAYTSEAPKTLEITEQTVTFTNTFTQKEIEYTISKEWENGNDTLHQNVDVNVYQKHEDGSLSAAYTLDGKEVQAQTLEVGQELVRFSSLPKYDLDGNVINYVGREITKIPNMFPRYDDALNGENSTQITNVYVSPLGTVIINKEWDGGPAARPETEYILEYKSDQENTYTDLGLHLKMASDQTQIIVPNLPMTDQNGKNIEYRVTEKNVPENYTVQVQGEVSEDATTQTFTVTNTYTSPKTQVSAEKHWIGGEAQRQDVVIQLTRRLNDEIYEDVEGKTQTVGTENTIMVFDNLDLTDHYGNSYQYGIREITELENFEVTTSDDSLTITNAFVSPLINIEGTKQWVNGPEVKPDITIVLEENGVETNRTQMLHNGTSEISFKQLPEFNEAGEKIVYTFNEESVENYVLSRSDDGLHLTNTYVIPHGNIHAHKIWNDNLNVHPTIELKLEANGHLSDQSVYLEDGITEAIFENLPLTDQFGKSIRYTVVESDVEGYIATRSEDGLTITNTLIEEKPDEENPNGDKPNEENPNGEKPDEENPNGENPDEENSNGKNPDIETPKVESEEVDASTPEVLGVLGDKNESEETDMLPKTGVATSKVVVAGSAMVILGGLLIMRKKKKK